ncbi:MAG: hypothetical protein K8F24_07610, partial [Bacteroidales bacterium]|nr:hypothetical protein [Bacteroidales bacterium]
MALYYDLNVFQDVYKLIFPVFEATKVFPSENKHPPRQVKEACFARNNHAINLPANRRKTGHQIIKSSNHQISKSPNHQINMKTFKLFFLATILMATCGLSAQVAVTTDGSSADVSAMLDVKSTEKGFLLPRMTEAQRDAITPVAGLIVFNSTTNKPNYYNGTE